MNIIAISGKLYSGKTTLAKNLEQSIPDSERVALATQLKLDIAALCNVTLEEIALNKDQYRKGLQWYGTDFRRWKDGEDYWVKRLVRYMLFERQLPTYFVDDVRFPNELTGLRNVAYNTGGQFLSVRLDIDKITQIERHIAIYRELPDESIFDHPSETALDEYDDWDVVAKATLPPLTIATLVHNAALRRGFAEGQINVGQL